MNIILFINKDFEANLAYNLLKPELLNHCVKIYYSDSVGSAKAKPSALLEMEYYEKEFFFKGLVEKIKRNKLSTTFEFLNEDFESFELAQCTNVNSPEFIEEVKFFEPDLFISIRFGKIFKEEIIKVPKKGILNLHSGILPDFKGIMGTIHTLKENRKEYGCTLHYISTKGIDTGEIIAIAKQPVVQKRSLLWHIIKLYPSGCALILDALEKLQTMEQLPCMVQDMTQGSYFSVPKEEDFQQLNALGFESFSMGDYQELLVEFVGVELRGLVEKKNLN